LDLEIIYRKELDNIDPNLKLSNAYFLTNLNGGIQMGIDNPFVPLNIKESMTSIYNALVSSLSPKEK
jgi:hypothetical protein